MLKNLFTSGVRIRLLELLLLSTESGWSASRLAGRVGAGISHVRAELNNLEAAGILVKDPLDATGILVYRANERCAILPELRSIMIKTSAVADVIRKGLKGQRINLTFVFGSMAAGKQDLLSDIDVLVIGSLPLDRVGRISRELKGHLGRALNFSIFPLSEWRERIRSNDSFARNVMAGSKIWITGDDEQLRKIAE